jgi:high-affinity Fe2+/Pb2+ permease
LLAAQGAIRAHVQALVEKWLERPSAPLWLLAFSCVASLRETLEAGLFLRGLWLRTGGAGVLEGAVLGLAGAACLAVAWRGLGTRVGMLAAFRLSAALLSLLAIQMMLGALAEYRARHLEALAAPVLPQGRWFGAFCAVLMVPPVAYILRCWWRESAPRV